MKERMSVIYASRWTLDDGTQGCTLHVLSSQVERPGAKGNQIAKITGPSAAYDQLTDVPGIYDLTMEMTTREGRGALRIQSAAPVSALDLSTDSKAVRSQQQ